MSEPPTELRQPRPVRISLDLGSDSTVAYVARRGRAPVRLDLQHYLYALADKPVLLRNDNGSISHRLKSRYALNSAFRTIEPMRAKQHPLFGYEEVLPETHPKQALLDHDAYNRLPNKATDGRLTAGDPNACLFRFVDDESRSFAFSELLPNAKLAFQSGVGLDRDITYAYGAEDTPARAQIRVHPMETIKNQLCLILQNFVRPHPALRDEVGRMPEWSECAVILTVPNTYSPFHRDVLAGAIQETLGCEVCTISESDAVVFHYSGQSAPDRDLSLDQLSSLKQRFLTIDVGKGTTDLTLMKISHRDASSHEKVSRGLPGDEVRILPHVYVQARTGRATGGAMMTFRIAEFLERRLDDAMANAFASMPGLLDDQRKQLASATRCPLRITTQSNVPEDARKSIHFGQLEQLAEWYKAHLDGGMVETGKRGQREYKISIPDYENAEALNELVAYIVVIASNARLAPINAGDTAQKLHLHAAVTRALFTISAEPTEGEKQAWQALTKQVQDYVKENVDDVLIDLATALPPELRTSEVKNAAKALSLMVGSSRGGSQPEAVRTHVVVAGQGSKFKPLRKRLDEVFLEAGLVKSETQKRPRKAWRQLFSDLIERLFGGEGGVPIKAVDRRVMYLSDENLKDGCAEGALAWYVNSPVMENAHELHGQLVLRTTGGVPSMVNMDALNREGKLELGPEELERQVLSWQVYYLPTRGRMLGSHDDQGALVGVLDATDHIVFNIRPDRDEWSQLIVTTADGQRIKLDESVHGRKGAEQLKEMLWPSMLVEERKS